MLWKISVESCFWKEFRGSCKWILKDRSTLFSCLVIQDTLINLFLCIRPETRCKESCSLRRSGSGPVTMSSGQHRAQKEGNSAKKYSMDTWLEGKKERGSKRIILKLLLNAFLMRMKTFLKAHTIRSWTFIIKKNVFIKQINKKISKYLGPQIW